MFNWIFDSITDDEDETLHDFLMDDFEEFSGRHECKKFQEKEGLMCANKLESCLTHIFGGKIFLHMNFMCV